MSKDSGKESGVSGAFLLFLVFLVLKLTHVIAWSWLWVTSPLWGGLALVAAGFLMFALFCVAMHLTQKIRR